MTTRSGALALVLALTVGCGGTDGVDAGLDGGSDAGPDAGLDAGSSVCAPACDMGRECYSGECVNAANDPRHCGACGVTCADTELCTGGSCTAIPCTTTCEAGETCCDGACCGGGEICCDPQGPVGTGPRCTLPDARGTCPAGCAPLCMCAAPDTPIATPDGDRPIASLEIGDLVYSVSGNSVVVVPILATHREPVSGHRVMRVTLEGGATLAITGGHPTADGRSFADLRAGDSLGELRVLHAEEVPYEHPYTHDILPGSDTGTYFAAGALIGSTLAR